jgi:hypothetical protein
MNKLIPSAMVVLTQVPSTSVVDTVQRVKYRDRFTFMSYVTESRWQYVYCM